LQFAIRVLQDKGLALGAGAIESAQITDDRIISFPDLSQAAVFPVTDNQYSAKAQEATPYLGRSNTSCGWEQHNPTGSTFTATFLCDSSVMEVLRSERQSGGGLALANSDELVLEYAPGGRGKKTSKGIKKEDAFQRDQLSIARKLACALRFPVSAPTTEEISSLTKAASA
jgi:hypothetical protein